MSCQEIEHDAPVGANAKAETHRVLIVDDEQAICFAYSKLLENELFSFDICESVETAIALLDRKKYMAVISDVRFAGSDNKDGIYFVSVLRNKQAQAKIILVTGYGNDELKRTANELGIYQYFEKPIAPSLLVSLLRSLHLVANKEEENEDCGQAVFV